MATDLLPYIADQQFHPSVFDTACHSVSLGPVTATFCMSLTPPSVSVVIANCQMSNLHPTCTIGGSSHGCKAELELTLDLSKKLDYNLTVCVPLLGCKVILGSINL